MIFAMQGWCAGERGVGFLGHDEQSGRRRFE